MFRKFLRRTPWASLRRASRLVKRQRARVLESEREAARHQEVMEDLEIERDNAIEDHVSLQHRYQEFWNEVDSLDLDIPPVPGHTCPLIDTVQSEVSEAKDYIDEAREAIDGDDGPDIDAALNALQSAEDYLGYIDMETIREANSDLRSAAEAGERIEWRVENVLTKYEGTVE